MKNKRKAGDHNDTDTKQKVEYRKNLRKFKIWNQQIIAIEYIAPGQGKEVINNQSDLYLSKKKGHRTEQ